MAEVLDYRGLRCPQPVMKAAVKIQTLPPGTTVEVLADCVEFPHQVKEWCDKSGRVFVNLVNKGAYHSATIRS